MSERTRAEQIAGIYQLALWLEQNPDIPIPYALQGHGYTSINIHAAHGDGDEKAVMAAAARAIPGRVEKDVIADRLFTIEGTIPGGVRVQVLAARDQVCKRVVTGTREVTKTVPDPMITVPTVEVTETVEDVEWVCEPILQDRTRAAVTS